MTTARDTTPPTAPTNLTATYAQTSDGLFSVTLKWDAATDNVAVNHYVVKLVGLVGPVGSKQVGWPGLARTFTEKGLSPGSYHYGVYAVDAAGNVSPPATVSVTITAPSGDNPYPNAGPWTVGGTVTDSYSLLSDLPAAFEPAWHSPVTAYTNSDGSGITPIDTPYGPGIQVVCTDANVTVWDSRCKAILCHGALSGHDVLGSVAQWTFDVKIPTQKIWDTANQGWFAGCIWELHTSAVVQPTTLNVDMAHDSPHPGTALWRASIRGSEFYGPAVIFDAWHRFDVQAYWTETANGFLRWYVDGQLFVNYRGQTINSGESNPYLQYGWYAGLGGVKNTSQFGPVVRRQFASLGS